ncbi:MAG: penicillin-binding protein 2 [Cryomorphaceae bacterium]|nr:MAG: penicillin-binding protein 2 [Cryomorphaceae bacterium]
MDYSDRKYVIGTMIVVVALVFIVRLFFIQVVDEQWKAKAANISERKITIYPARGLIYDRFGKLMVGNTAVYDLMVIPKDVGNLDTALFCKVVDVTRQQFREKMTTARKYSLYKPSIFEKQIPADQYARIAEQMHHFNGFYSQSRTLRSYPDSIAAHLLGYVSEASRANIEKDPYYRPGDYIGANGVENIYEKALRGKRGSKLVVVDVHNRVQGSYKEGRYDTMAYAGKDLTASIDLELQKYGEALLKNKRGSIVAIEPATGEILAMVTNPSYNPNLLVGRVRSANYQKLAKDTLNPLFNRAVMAQYPPGSTFKLVNALIGLEEETITTRSYYTCNMGYYYGSRRLGCHAHNSHTGFHYSIETSCNAYYCHVFKGIIDKYPNAETGYNHWRDYVLNFGLGQKLGVDITSEVSGFVPPSTYYDRYYGQHRWKPHTIISLAIGQGELGVTPLQMANMCAVIANRGWYYAPHVIRAIDGEPITDSTYTVKNHTGIDPKWFEETIQGMHQVIERGTGRGAKFGDIEMCGKTGTAQNPHGKDHSIFIAFAPKDNPQIAMAVYVENVGFGSTWAAPITSLMIEKYLTDSISRPHIEQRMLDANLLNN